MGCGIVLFFGLVLGMIRGLVDSAILNIFCGVLFLFVLVIRLIRGLINSVILNVECGILFLFILVFGLIPCLAVFKLGCWALILLFFYAEQYFLQVLLRFLFLSAFVFGALFIDQSPLYAAYEWFSFFIFDQIFEDLWVVDRS